MTVSQVQLGNAAGLWAMCQIRGLSDRVALAVICCVLDESSLQNVTHGDLSNATSIGFFQQTSLYGPVQDRVDPAKSLSMFLDGGPDHQPAFLAQPYTVGTLDDLARCIQAVQGSQYNGKDIDPKTGKPYPYAGNYISNMPLALEILQQVKVLAFTPIRAQIRALNTALLPVSMASTNMTLATQVRT